MRARQYCMNRLECSTRLRSFKANHSRDHFIRIVVSLGQLRMGVGVDVRYGTMAPVNAPVGEGGHRYGGNAMWQCICQQMGVA